MRIFLIAVLALFAAQPSLAREDIRSFNARIAIQENGDLAVVETITVRAEGREIKRGIYRDFPTQYIGPNKERKNVRFDVLSVKRNGFDEPYKMEKLRHGKRVRIGDGDVLLQRGEHVYEIAYVTDRQIGFFEEWDELYWNVTGNGWAFDIQEVSATLYLPKNAPILDHDVFTGERGQQGKDARVAAQESGRIRFASTRPFNEGEGMTILVSWPKGYVPEPSAAENAERLLSDNTHILIGLIGFLFTFGYFYFIWGIYGKDPKKGPEVPRYEPPKNFSAAATRFVQYMGFDDQMLSTVLVSLAVKGAIKIVDEGGYFIELQNRNAKGLSKGEKAVLRKLFPRGMTSALEVDRKSYRLFRDVKGVLEIAIQSEYEERYFKTNLSWSALGMFFGFVTVVLASISGPDPVPLVTALLGGSVLFVFLFVGLSRSSQLMAKMNAWFKGKYLSAKFKVILIWTAVIIAIPIVILVLNEELGLYVSALVVATVLLCALFQHLLKAPTQLGRQIMDEIDGFKLFLSLTEKDRWDILHPRDLTPELFEKYLPFALALDVSHAWSEKFASTLEKSSYRPTWYRGHGHFSLYQLDRVLSRDFASAMSKASIPPQSHTSSSGFSGGFSGGGGGGGGGGGW